MTTVHYYDTTERPSNEDVADALERVVHASPEERERALEIYAAEGAGGKEDHLTTQQLAEYLVPLATARLADEQYDA